MSLSRLLYHADPNRTAGHRSVPFYSFCSIGRQLKAAETQGCVSLVAAALPVTIPRITTYSTSIDFVAFCMLPEYYRPLRALLRPFTHGIRVHRSAELPLLRQRVAPSPFIPRNPSLHRVTLQRIAWPSSCNKCL